MAKNSQIAKIAVLALMTLGSDSCNGQSYKNGCKGPYGHDCNDYNGCNDHNGCNIPKYYDGCKIL